jgi:hypothetical protein
MSNRLCCCCDPSTSFPWSLRLAGTREKQTQGQHVVRILLQLDWPIIQLQTLLDWSTGKCTPFAAIQSFAVRLTLSVQLNTIILHAILACAMQHCKGTNQALGRFCGRSSAAFVRNTEPF